MVVNPRSCCLQRTIATRRNCGISQTNLLDVKDAFHQAVIHGELRVVNPAKQGSKSSAWHQLVIAKKQLELLLNERYIHPNGHLPAYELLESTASSCLSLNRTFNRTRSLLHH
ncbi:MAG: hypothetical protein PHD43_05375 [Methylococcales bacterium]|nr:hypothetical protein [Methylococcales bacterium]